MIALCIAFSSTSMLSSFFVYSTANRDKIAGTTSSPSKRFIVASPSRSAVTSNPPVYASSKTPNFSSRVVTTSSYHPDFSTNACGIKPDKNGMNTAMGPLLAKKLGVPKPGPGSAVCGRKLKVKNSKNGKIVEVTVLDLRGDEHGLDLQVDAFKKIDDGEGVKTGKLENLEVQFS